MIEMTRPEIDQMLDEQPIGRLALCGADGRPYVIPLPFCWLGGVLYLRLPLTGRKGRLIEENDRVCFEVDCHSDSMDQYASVLVEGRIFEVTSIEEKLRVRQATGEKYLRLRNGYRPGHGRATPIEQLAMRKIVVESLSGRRNQPRPAAQPAAEARASA